jgi:hypothetical protein
MASTDLRSSRSKPGHMRHEERQTWILFGVMYPFCLAFAIAARLTLKSRRASTSVLDSRQSVFREAWAAAWSVVPFAFR